jgi:hypothetical protein
MYVRVFGPTICLQEQEPITTGIQPKKGALEMASVKVADTRKQYSMRKSQSEFCFYGRAA